MVCSGNALVPVFSRNIGLLAESDMAGKQDVPGIPNKVDEADLLQPREVQNLSHFLGPEPSGLAFRYIEFAPGTPAMGYGQACPLQTVWILDI
jgi:hypothetical protein